MAKEDKKFKGSLTLDWINKDKSLYYEIDEKEGRGIKPVWVDKNDIRVSEPRILNFLKTFFVLRAIRIYYHAPVSFCA